MTILYHTSLYLYLFASLIAGFFSRKAALFYRGRRGLLKRVESEMAKIAAERGCLKDVVWFHCASVGEFEQARPVIEKHKNLYPDAPVVLTFFSPSGFELRKNYSFADAVFYLPMDTKGNATKFIELVNPAKVIFVKYEFWRNYLGELKKRGVPVYLISAIFREDQHFFKWWGGYFRGVLKYFEHLFVQDSHSESLLKGIGIENVTVCGDTRFDRVKEVTGTSVKIDPLALFSQDSLCMVAGSTWPADEEILAGFLKSRESGLSAESGLPFKLVIAPHEVDESHINKITNLFSGFKIVRFSETKNFKSEDNPSENCMTDSVLPADKPSFAGRKPLQNILEEADIFIIDTIGILSVAYRYGSVAYIGGGFGTGIHNILEAASYGIPVIFGPKFHKFKEAKDLISLGGASSVDSLESFSRQMIQVLNQPVLRKSRGEISKEYVEKNLGATSAILASIYPLN